MPRKTRQQKILTELRTLRTQVRVPVQSISPTEKVDLNREGISKSRLTTLMSTSTRTVTGSIQIGDYSYVLRDLRKVAVLASIALLIEIVLSLTLNLGFANLLKVIKL